MKKKEGNGVGVGTASVLMIVVVLAFTTFGVLSFVSARADWEMSRKAAGLAADWYAAEGRLQERLAQVDAALAAGEAVFSEEGLLELTENVRDGQVLQARLRCADGGERYEIAGYELVNTGEWSAAQGLNIWEGED